MASGIAHHVTFKVCTENGSQFSLQKYLLQVASRFHLLWLQTSVQWRRFPCEISFLHSASALHLLERRRRDPKPFDDTSSSGLSFSLPYTNSIIIIITTIIRLFPHLGSWTAFPEETLPVPSHHQTTSTTHQFLPDRPQGNWCFPSAMIYS